MNIKQNNDTLKLVSILTLVTLAIFSRVAPHLPNLTALGAAALLAGSSLRPRWVALSVPLIALLISDSILGFYSGMWVSYLAWITVTLGASVFLVNIDSGPRVRWGRRGVAAILASTVFFVISNFGVWLSGGIYAHTLQGFVECYTLAIPFLATQVAGDLSFTFLLFAGLDMLVKLTSSASYTAKSVS